ncbi:hypothetical protein PCASD_07993 [Puccinia coronata f. sp. avenae]|uniref:Uncharacterized protein n=1 Tax=Puccinia coronata f. sp. avenae TaxID=200324 RepID=A0A2N5UNZ6_9BASI|nr:hypothetical protein PCASD_07993 [Puccinia coronata f. sp. avenae]
MRKSILTTLKLEQPQKKLSSLLNFYLPTTQKKKKTTTTTTTIHEEGVQSIESYQRIREKRTNNNNNNNNNYHQSISHLIQQSRKTNNPTQVISLFHDLKHIWKYTPSDQDNRAYVDAAAATITTNTRSEQELALLIRLAIKYHLNHQLDTFLSEKPIPHYEDQLLIHGSLLLLLLLPPRFPRNNPQQRDNNVSLEFILDQLKKKIPLEDWIQQDLIQRLAADQSLELLLFQTLAQLSRGYSNRNHTINLVDRLLTHIPIPTDGTSIAFIQSIADRIHQTTNVDIFNEKHGRLAVKLFIRLSSSYSFEQVWEWYQLSKTRTGGRVLEPCLVSILKFKPELMRYPDRREQILSDFRGLAFVSKSLAPTDLIECIEHVLWLAIGIKSAPLAGLALHGDLISMLEGKQLMKSETMADLLGELLVLAESREQAYELYERLSRLGRATPRFFERLLREYLALCHAPPPRASFNERPQALPMPRLMAILHHMKQAGIPPDGQTYTVLLNHFSTVVRLNPRNLSTRLQLERIHTLIKLDANLEPDALLAHQLFKAFSYNALYDKAWAIWDQFFVPQKSSSPSSLHNIRAHQAWSKISNPTFATMFDLAGFESERHGDGRLNLRAIDGWRFLASQALLKVTAPTTPESPLPSSSSSSSSSSFTTTVGEEEPSGGTLKREMSCGYLNKNLFDAWVECLCRARRMEEALTLVFPEMDDGVCGTQAAAEGGGQMMPRETLDKDRLYRHVTRAFVDQRTLSILLRFCKREDLSNPHRLPPHSPYLPAVHAAIQTHFPTLWNSVRDQGPFN